MLQVDISEIVKNYAQVLAWALAAVYFIVKLVQGYLVIDLSVTVSPTRQHTNDPDLDYLVASVQLVRGDKGSIRMHDAVLVVRQSGDEQRTNLPIHRFSFRRDGQFGPLLRLDFAKTSSRVPTLNLAPGETVTLSECLKVRRDAPCVVEAFVLGTGFASPVVGQWRASAVSLPLEH